MKGAIYTNNRSSGAAGQNVFMPYVADATLTGGENKTPAGRDPTGYAGGWHEGFCWLAIMPGAPASEIKADPAGRGKPIQWASTYVLRTALPTQ